METPLRDEIHEDVIIPVSPVGYGLFQELVAAGTSTQHSNSGDVARETSPTSSGGASNTLQRLPPPPRGPGGESRAKRPCLEPTDVQCFIKET
jgi:hypothetical protein